MERTLTLTGAVGYKEVPEGIGSTAGLLTEVKDDPRDFPRYSRKVFK